MTIRVFATGQSNMLGRNTSGPALSGVSSSVSVWNNINPLGANGSAFVTAAAAQAAGVFDGTDKNNLAVRHFSICGSSRFCSFYISAIY